MEPMYSDRLFSALEKNPLEVGSLLVSAPTPQWEESQRSVVLIIDINPEIVFGVNLVHRSDVAVANILPEWLEAVAKPQALYIGGPVSPHSVVGIGIPKPGVDVEAVEFLTKLVNRLVHVNLRAEPKEVMDTLEGLRLFVGYSEWEPNELQNQINAGDWYVAPALPSDVIAGGSVDLWGDVMRRQPMPLPLFATYPADQMDN